MTTTQTNWKNVGNWHWVQKNVTPWAKEYIREHLVASSESEGDVKVNITDLLNMDGDAELSQRKGKIITIFDLVLSLAWEGETPRGTKASGKISIPEFDHDSHVDKLEIDVSIEETEDAEKMNIKKVADKLLPKLISAGLRSFQTDMVESHGKDVYIKPEEMGGHPTVPTYQPTNFTGASGANLQKATKPSSAGYLGGVTTIEQTVEFLCAANDLMEVFFDVGRISAWSRNKAVISRNPGSEFSLFGDSVTGTLLEYEDGKKFVQKWRLKSWPPNHYSTATFVLKQGDQSTTLNLYQKDVPIGEKEITEGNWNNYYWIPIKATFGYGGLL